MPSTVLFIDDEAPMLRALKRDFAWDYDISVAYSAIEAQKLLHGSRRFDVIVSDVSMPEMDGLEFIQLVTPLYPRTRFVVLTGNCDAETHQIAEALPSVARVLTKPASREEIVEAIELAASTVAVPN